MIGVITAADKAAARTAIGTGTLAVQNVGAVDIDGGAIDATAIGATTASTGAFTTLAVSEGVTYGGDLSIVSGDPTRLYIESSGDNGNDVFLSLKSSDTEWLLKTNRGDQLNEGLTGSGNQGDFFIREETQGVNAFVLETDSGNASFVSDLKLGGNLSLDGDNKELRFYEGANYVGFEAPTLTADQIWVLPTADGSTGQVIKTDGDGTLSFTTIITAEQATKLDGIADSANNYALPTASTSILGGIKVGTNLSVLNGVLSSTNTTYSVKDGELTQNNFTNALKTKLDGLGTISTQDYDDVNIDGGNIDGSTIATSNITVGSGKTLNVSAGTLTLASDQISGDKVEGGTIAAITISDLTATTANIDGGNIDGSTIATSNITVGSGKTLNVSAGTLTLASDQISGDKVEGGTIAAITISDLTATTANIDGGNIDGSTIATSNITVGSGKTLNVSAGTLTLADDQISGDKVEGGTIAAITISDLTATTANIDGGNIDGSTIATSNITVGSGKTLNVSAGTLTLASDQISGDTGY